MTTSYNQATTGPNSSGPSPSTSSTGSSSGYSTTTVPTSTGSSSILCMDDRKERRRGRERERERERVIKYAVPLSDHCKCLDARYSYWSLHPDVYNDNIDPVYHYQVCILLLSFSLPIPSLVFTSLFIHIEHWRRFEWLLMAMWSVYRQVSLHQRPSVQLHSC